MREALVEAQRAEQEGEVPVGALAVQDGRIIAREHNRREQTQDPTAHAELLVIRRAAMLSGSWRLLDVTVYVTLEPCPMCAAALVLARIKRLVFGAPDPKMGAVDTIMALLTDSRLNHQVDFVGGVLSDESATMLRRFFEGRRAATPVDHCAESR